MERHAAVHTAWMAITFSREMVMSPERQLLLLSPAMSALASVIQGSLVLVGNMSVLGMMIL